MAQYLNEIERELLVAFGGKNYVKARFILDDHPDIDVNQINPGGWKLLHIPAYDGDLQLIIYLVNIRKTDVNIQSYFGVTAFAYAAMQGHLHICQFLDEIGADLNIKDNDARTPFMIAARNGQINVCQFLQQKAVDVNLRDKSGKTAFMLAGEKGHLNICQYLQAHGTNINAKDLHDRTAFMLAASGGHLHICRYLDENGADLEAQDKYGVTALHLAAISGHQQVCLYLFARGVNLNVTNIHGQTAITQIHSTKGDFELLKHFTLAGAVWPEFETHFITGLSENTEILCRSYISRKQIRETILLLMTAKLITKQPSTEKQTFIKLLNLDLIRKLFVVIGGLETKKDVN
jgi:ankyrin repeat protein